MPAARQRWEGSMDDIGWLLPVAGGLTGMVIGAAARLNRFCTLAALERHWYAGDSTGLRTWVLAAAIAIVATQALVLSGAIDVSGARSGEHTSELQSLMRISYAVFCLKNKTDT